MVHAEALCATVSAAKTKTKREADARSGSDSKVKNAGFRKPKFPFTMAYVVYRATSGSKAVASFSCTN